MPDFDQKGPEPEASHGGDSLRTVLFVCFFISGVTGLAYEVLWARYFSLFIGGATYAHTIVLATFMGGLALGNYLFGRLADRVKRRLRLYAMLELGIGVTALLFPSLFELLGSAYLPLARLSGFGAAANLPLKLLFCGVSILAPTVLMGGTLPVLTRFVVRNMGELGHRVGQLYFLNTGGAVLGSLLAGFVLLPALGMDASTSLFAVINLLIGLIFLVLSRYEEEGGTSTPDTVADSGPRYTSRQVRWVFLTIAISGAISMLYELVWVRLLSLVLGSSAHSFTIMLVTFISGIALGGLVASRLLDERPEIGAPVVPRDALKLFAWVELGVFVSVLAMLPVYERLPFYFNVLSSMFERAPHTYALYLAVQVLVCVALMFVPTVLIGMTLPLASRVVVQAVDRVGVGVGRTFSLNTLGTLVGAALTGLVLIPTLGLQQTLYLGVGGSALLGLLLVRVVTGTTRRRFSALVAVVVGVAIAAVTLLPSWDQGLLHSGLFRRKGLVAMSFEELRAQRDRMKVLFAEDGANTSVSVLRHRETGVLYLKVNGKTDAGTGNDMTTQLWLGHLGMFLHPDPKEVLVIGLGSGITAGAVLRHPDVTVDQIEISPAVVHASALFAEANGDIAENPRYTLHVGDAKEFFKLEPERRFDIIISEPSNPWISGVSNLFTEEYFAEARTHLRGDGLMVQWVHLYEMSDDVLRIVLDTFGAVFPYVTVWQSDSADVLLVGAERPLPEDPAVVAQRIEARLRRPEVFADLNRPHLREHVSHPLQILASQLLSEAAFREFFPGRPPLNTDDRPILEYAAPRAFFYGAEATALRSIDERRRTAAVGDLLLSRRLAGAPLDEAEEAALREHHARRDSPYDKPLLASLTAAAYARAPSSPEAIALTLSAGSPASVRAELWRRLQALGGIPPRMLPSLAHDEVERLDAETSVYFAPGPSGSALVQLVSRAGEVGAPDTPDTLYRAARVLFRRGELKEAEAVLDRLVAIIGDRDSADGVASADVQFLCGWVEWRRGDPRAALDHLKASLGSDPEHWQSRQLLYLPGHLPRVRPAAAGDASPF